MTFTEIADRVWVSRTEPHDLSVGLIGGERGLVLVDTQTSPDDARGVLAGIRSLGAGEVVAIVNTHDHFDHIGGNPLFQQEYDAATTHAHEDAAVSADRPLSSAGVIDLGDRVVELVHPGRAHTAGDVVVRVPDADVVFVGDLVEESGPPDYGDDSFPMEWPLALDLVVGLLTPATLVVPGHGAVVDRDFVQEQRADLGVVAETIRDLAARGVPVADALAAADGWPFPTEGLAGAVRRGYAQLPRAQKRLPLV